MLLCSGLVILALSAQPKPASFSLLDVETVDGRPVNFYKPLELADEPIRPVKWREPPGGERHYSLLRLGPDPDTALDIAWSPESSSLWIDADRDRTFAPDERLVVKPGTSQTVSVTIPGANPPLRTLLFRPGLLGGAPRYCVRGAMSGSLLLGTRAYPALLLDGDADGAFDAPSLDRVCLDLDEDGHFDPVSEQFPLGTPVRLGSTSYTVSSDPWARSVSAHERDTRLGRILLTLGGPAWEARVLHFSANLVSRTGELVSVSELDTPTEAHVGLYRVVNWSLELADNSGRIWQYEFLGSSPESLEVTPNGEARISLLDGLDFNVNATLLTDIHPGDDVYTTPHLDLGSGLYLSRCSSRLANAVRGQDRTALIDLKSPSGARLDRAVSGFS